MILPVLKIFNPTDLHVLRTPSVDVATFDSDIANFCHDLVDTMFALNGVGLAAPQVGRNLNIFVMRTMQGLEKDTLEHIVVINPHTAIQSGKTEFMEEGCLSIPGLWGSVERFPYIGSLYYDVAGKRNLDHFTGFQARIYQHEQDHLAGTLFIDRSTVYTKQNRAKT